VQPASSIVKLSISHPYGSRWCNERQKQNKYNNSVAFVVFLSLSLSVCVRAFGRVCVRVRARVIHTALSTQQRLVTVADGISRSIYPLQPRVQRRLVQEHGEISPAHCVCQWLTEYHDLSTHYSPEYNGVLCRNTEKSAPHTTLRVPVTTSLRVASV